MNDDSVLIVNGETMTMASNLVMGVVNASPESFSDGAQSTSVDQQLDRAAKLISDGADILDIGGQSAVTNQPEIPVEVEIARVTPIIETVRRDHPDTMISIDTYRPAVARAAIAAGASIVNDVSGLADPTLARICADTHSALVVMHTSAPPKVRRQRLDLYHDVAAEVVQFLADRIELAISHGLDRRSIVVDPGPDFTKTPHQTLAVLRRIADVRALGRPVLLALSRKDFLGALLQATPRGRDIGTAAALAHFASQPGYIMRVHDVQAARQVQHTIDALIGRVDIDPDYVLPDELRYEPRP